MIEISVTQILPSDKKPSRCKEYELLAQRDSASKVMPGNLQEQAASDFRGQG